jgi:two-component system, OmpR family, response regulator ArlR
LLARIRSVLRRSINVKQNDAILVFNDIQIDTEAHMVKVQQKSVDLTKTEYDLLVYLIQQKNRVVTRDLILEHVWGYSADIETNVVDVYIRHLRSKLPKEVSRYIETVRGVGYVMRE